ncbi:serine hydrolase domain-containing protein [Roseateles asaccharophilus]|uniref:CubicO group peptidase (Beta-lactamase class C family) n=1 Tax=Roseateles asaccharophilus TaxID=582607 RepID=A0ABU2A1U6_9BURK|nr:serine hydrolase domain-containing protein [Roseateles asaccharophilus]MDR7331151.1 CubicO group peptidase (beta-lactamase class C family) [Roseateles asaccharophilus]
MKTTALAVALACAALFHAPVTTATPPKPALVAGFSAERLQRLDTAINDEIARQQLAGGVMVVLRDGKPVVFKAYGQQDIEGAKPMRTDTIFRIASMTKALTSVAAMMLYEEGRFLLKDPVAKYLPAFANLQVARPDGSTEKARRSLTIHDLLTHTAGMSYGPGPAKAAYDAAGMKDWYLVGHDETLAAWTDRMAALPLQSQPGEAFIYGYATDVLGRLVEVVSGQSLDQFIKTRITDPLRMPDTSFHLPPEKVGRLAHVYGLEGGQLKLMETSAKSDFVNGPRKLFSGGAGMVSTAGDYTRFLQMLLNKGELDGQRLLAPKTVELMTADHLADKARGDADGFGLGFWVNVKRGGFKELGSEGAFGWGSAYFPQYTVDPKERLVILLMTQLRPAGNSTLNLRVRNLTYQALIR